MSIAEPGAIQKRILAELSILIPELSNAGRELVERISTPNWILEWELPVWLSDRFSFPRALRENLVLSNICMIAYARVLDDLADQESEPYSGYGPVLGSALHHTWIRQYIGLFGGHSSTPQILLDFWKYFEKYMADWLRATLNIVGEGFPAFAFYKEADFDRLAARGAFLKICPVAACLLAGRADLIQPLVSSINDLTVGVVMLDEQFDWAKDLEAGRYNTFVAYCSDLPQSASYQEANHSAILKEIYLGKSGQPYFDVLCRYVQRAHQWAARADCVGLVEYIDWFEKEARTCADFFLETANSQLQAVASQFKNNGNGEIKPSEDV